MGKKIALIIAVVLVIFTGMTSYILLKKSKDQKNAQETESLLEPADDLTSSETDKLGERPSYSIEDYMEIKDYKEIPLVEETEAETETKDIMGLTGDMDVQVELLNRAKNAGVDFRYELDDEDAATISGQRFQTMKEYRAYLSDIIQKRNEYNKKVRTFENYLIKLYENAEFSGLPEDVVKYDEDAIEVQVEKYAISTGTTVEALKEKGQLENVRGYFERQNSGFLQKEMCLRYVAEKNGISIEEGDLENMFSFFHEVYGEDKVKNMQDQYTDAQLDYETLHFKVINTLL